MAPQRWEVVGGGDKGGIVVREGAGLTSTQVADRLATGAVVEEVELAGERLHYKRISGEGPESGWVSTSLKGKALLVHAAAAAAAAEPAAPASSDPPAVASAGSGAEPAAAAAAPAAAEPWAVRVGDYYVTLGKIFKKTGTDPATAGVRGLSRKVGSIIHTTGKVWKGPSGGFWVELDTSKGDSGAGEKPGYVMIDASGFGTPGPCLQLADEADGPPLLLRAPAPEGAKPWDGASPGADKEFVAFPKTTVAEIKTVVGMLFGLAGGGISVFPPSGRGAGALADATTVKEAGFDIAKPLILEAMSKMKLVVMSPLEEGVKLLDLEIALDATVGSVKTMIATTTGLKKGSMIMAKGKMGQRVGEGANLDESDQVVNCGYKDGDEIAFMYLGDLEGDLAPFVKK